MKGYKKVHSSTMLCDGTLGLVHDHVHKVVSILGFGNYKITLKQSHDNKPEYPDKPWMRHRSIVTVYAEQQAKRKEDSCRK